MERYTHQATALVELYEAPLDPDLVSIFPFPGPGFEGLFSGLRRYGGMLYFLVG